MTRRIVLAALSLALLGGALATTASAEPRSVCVDLGDGRLLPPGICIGTDSRAD